MSVNNSGIEVYIKLLNFASKTQKGFMGSGGCICSVCTNIQIRTFPNQLATVRIPTSNVLMKTRVYKHIVI